VLLRFFHKEAVVHLAELEAQLVLERVFVDHYQAVLTYAARRTSHRVDAEEVAAETMAIAWQRLEVLCAVDSPRIWLYATARRVLANQRRAASRRAALADKLVEDGCLGGHVADATVDLDNDEDLAPVLQALEVLRDRDQELIRLAVLEDLTHAEIAEVLDCREIQVRSRLYRARAHFRRAYEELVADPSGASDGKGS